MDLIIILALSATTIAKTLVDLARMAFDPPRWVPPVLALVVGVLGVVLLMVASEQPLTLAAAAQAIAAGILAGGSAVGVTELQRKTDGTVVPRG